MTVRDHKDLMALLWSGELGTVIFSIERFKLMTEEMGIFGSIEEIDNLAALEMKRALEKIEEGSRDLMEAFEKYQPQLQKLKGEN